jgi:hypothetical protein
VGAYVLASTVVTFYFALFGLALLACIALMHYGFHLRRRDAERIPELPDRDVGFPG